MSENTNEKIVIFVTHAGEDPERASIPFVMGNAALAMDVDVTIILQGTGVLVAKKGCYDHVFAAGLDPLKKLVDTFIEFGGKILVCIPCLEERKITKDLLVETAQPVKAGRVIQEVLEAKAVLNY
ncbi:MAG: multidrug transporter [Candidatus Schekmanbacteria bacterium RBG_13_48_7]|uniref:Multidrug transporter n=1 Tax=Candidatus Schekmanbacteria bacterium RBG_13_48_7 TaxID=1817878 RepID=A0A1F7RXN2_9BACT|nr:MAG: multidrug transporter [Candidatus Schekmanbacteria bacterium RBG_13_48_7]